MASTAQVLANVNFSRYSSAVFAVGQKEVWRAFHWLYHHHHHHEPQLYVGECLRNTVGGMARIGAKEKAALDRREDPANMDIPLLYRLLQHTCGLTPETASFAWNKPQSETEQQRLEHLLYRVKEVRNALCHDPTAFMHMTDAELGNRLEELTKLLCNIVQEAGKRSAQPAAEVEDAVASIKERINHIQASMPPSATLPQEFALLAKRELAEQWQGCTTRGEQLSPPLLRWAVGGQEVALNSLLQGPGEEQSPQVVVVLGEAGIGKSSLCWQLMEAWLQDDPQLPEVAAVDLVVMVECRRVFTRDLTRLLVEELLPQTCRRCRPEEVPDLLGALRVLWLVDGFEEATADARSLLCRLVDRCSSSNGHVVVLTGQQDYIDEVRTTLSHSKTQLCHVAHCGLTRRGFHTLLASLLQEPGGEGCGEPVWGARCTVFTKEVTALSPDLLQELHNPLKLMLAVRLWEEGQLGEAAGAPLTGLYVAIQDSLVAKLVAKLWAKNSLAEAEAEERVRRWVAALCQEALAMWARGCFVGLDKEAEQHLRERAFQLLLPYTDCFSTFLVCRGRPGAQHSFLHHTQQGVMAAQHLCTVVLQGHTAEEVKCLLLPGQPDNTSIDHFLPVLLQTATSLAAEENLDQERAGVLAKLLDQCRLCQWLEVVRHTKCCLAMACEAHRRLTDWWLVTDNTVQAAFTLVRIGVPCAITINLCKDTRNNPDLLPLLRSLSQSPVEVSLLVDHCLLYGIQPNVPLYSVDDLLQPLCGPASSCQLVGFKGTLTGAGCCALQHHQHTLQVLGVRVLDPLALDQVILLTHQTETLKSIGIGLFCTLDAAPNMSVSERVEVNLFLPKVEDREAKRAVALIRRISHNFNELTLGTMGSVKPVTVCRMVKAFKKQKVRAKSLGMVVRLTALNAFCVRHLHISSLPPSHPMTQRDIYNMWVNPKIDVNVAMKLKP